MYIFEDSTRTGAICCLNCCSTAKYKEPVPNRQQEDMTLVQNDCMLNELALTLNLSFSTLIDLNQPLFNELELSQKTIIPKGVWLKIKKKLAKRKNMKSHDNGTWNKGNLGRGRTRRGNQLGQRPKQTFQPNLVQDTNKKDYHLFAPPPIGFPPPPQTQTTAIPQQAATSTLKPALAVPLPMSIFKSKELTFQQIPFCF